MDPTWTNRTKVGRMLNRGLFGVIATGAFFFVNVLWGAPRELVVFFSVFFSVSLVAAGALLPRSDQVWMLRWPLTVLGIGLVAMLPLGIFGPVGGIRFWVLAATVLVAEWYMVDWWPRWVRFLVALVVASGPSWAITFHAPAPVWANHAWLVVISAVLLLITSLAWIQRRFPIQGAEPITIQAPA